MHGELTFWPNLTFCWSIWRTETHPRVFLAACWIKKEEEAPVRDRNAKMVKSRVAGAVKENGPAKLLGQWLGV